MSSAGVLRVRMPVFMASPKFMVHLSISESGTLNAFCHCLSGGTFPLTGIVQNPACLSFSRVVVTLSCCALLVAVVSGGIAIGGDSVYLSTGMNWSPQKRFVQFFFTPPPKAAGFF